MDLAAWRTAWFASLLIGTIFSTIGTYLFDLNYSIWGQEFALLMDSKTFAYAVQGAAMAGAIAYSMKSPPFVIYSCLAVGYATNSLGGAGGPLAVFFVTLIAVFLGKLVSKRTLWTSSSLPLSPSWAVCSSPP